MSNSFINFFIRLIIIIHCRTMYNNHCITMYNNHYITMYNNHYITMYNKDNSNINIIKNYYLKFNFLNK